MTEAVAAKIARATGIGGAAKPFVRGWQPRQMEPKGGTPKSPTVFAKRKPGRPKMCTK